MQHKSAKLGRKEDVDMGNKEKDYRWLGWCRWGVAAIVIAVLIWNFATYGELNFSTIHWVILGVCVVAELVLWAVKRKLRSND
jgi:hypothetical protein